MLEELRLYPRSLAARDRGRCPGERETTERGAVDPSLSTGCTEGSRLRSTGASMPIHSAWRIPKEVVA